MEILLEKVNPKFRNLVDLLFFSNRMDIDPSDFKLLLKDKNNYIYHFNYLWERFLKSLEIFWENGSEFWFNRLSILLSLNDKKITGLISDSLEKRINALLKSKSEIDIRYDLAYLQYIEYCKVRSFRKENLAVIKNYLSDISSYINVAKIANIIEPFIPFVFKDNDEFIKIITNKTTNSIRNFDLLLVLEQQGWKIDRQPLIKLAKEILIGTRNHNEKNNRAFFAIINDSEILSKLKAEYNISHRDQFISLLKSCNLQILEDYFLKNIKNILELDPTVVDELAEVYADNVYNRYTGHNRANVDRLIKLIKTFPQISPKKILVYLSSNNKMSDIKYILLAFPELKNLSVFV